MNEWTAILTLFGGVVGATLQYWFSRSAEARKQLQLLQSQSYVDYLRAVTKAAYARSPDAAPTVFVALVMRCDKTAAPRLQKI